MLLLFCLVLLLSLSVAGVFFAVRISRFLQDVGICRISSSLFAFLTLIITFSGLVALGMSGSSLRLQADKCTFVRHDLIPLIGKSRSVRSDESLIFTPMAIGQYYHNPSYPVVNRNIGTEGQNMLVVGMSGVPVKHLSALARPATWGFFFLGLRQALAWYWWFPFFSCVITLWWLLNLAFPGRWQFMLALAIIFTLSPYAVAWSFWPSYVVFFPSLAMSIILYSLKRKAWIGITMLSLPLGLSFAGFVLVLYPPWQISLGYLYLFFFAGVVLRDRLYASFRWQHIMMLGLSFLVAGLVIISWWSDAQVAIQTMKETIYPGQRDMALGGDGELWFWAKGVGNIITIHKTFGYSNASEMASFVYVLLPLVWGIISRFHSERRADPLAVLLLLFIFFAWLYYFIGISPWFARISLLGRCSGSRTDLALGLAQLLLIAVLFTKGRDDVLKSDSFMSKLFFKRAISVVWVGILLLAFWHMTSRFENFFGSIRLYVWIVVTIAVLMTGFASFYLLSGNERYFTVFFGTLTALISLPFNPVVRAPGFFCKKPGFPCAAFSRERVVFVDNDLRNAMMFMAAGNPVVNGTHYYPQFSFWQRVDSLRSMQNQYNRYQHLLVDVKQLSTDLPYRIEAKRPDEVSFDLDGFRFDFRNVSADLVIIPDSKVHFVCGNSSLIPCSSAYGWRTFKVRR